MARFIAEVSFRFESQSVETAGAELRRLGDAAQDAGFELVRGKVTPGLDAQELPAAPLALSPDSRRLRRLRDHEPLD